MPCAALLFLYNESENQLPYHLFISIEDVPMLLAAHLLVTALFLVLGIVFSRGKGTSLIAGYNTASPEEKAKYDEKKLCKAMSRLMFVLALCWLVIALSDLCRTMWLLWLGLGLFVAASIGGCMYVDRKCRR